MTTKGAHHLRGNAGPTRSRCPGPLASAAGWGCSVPPKSLPADPSCCPPEPAPESVKLHKVTYYRQIPNFLKTNYRNAKRYALNVKSEKVQTHKWQINFEAMTIAPLFLRHTKAT